MPVINLRCPKERTYLLVDPVVDESQKLSFGETQSAFCADLEGSIACAVSEGAPYGHLIEQYGALCKDCTAEAPGEPIDPDMTVPCLSCD